MSTEKHMKLKTHLKYYIKTDGLHKPVLTSLYFFK